MTETALDALVVEMSAAPEDVSVRVRFFARFADAELFLLLEHEATGDQVSPRLFDLPDGRFVAIFDTLERLVTFAQHPSPYVSLTGRALALMLEAQHIGAILNPGDDLAYAVEPDAMSWLRQVTEQEPAVVPAHITEVTPPLHVPEDLLKALDAKLAGAPGLAQAAYLVGVRYSAGADGYLLGFVDAVDGAQPALARAANEALGFSGLGAAALDVGFFAEGEDFAAKLAKVGLRFDLPKQEAGLRTGPSAPGMDPSRPPRWS